MSRCTDFYSNNLLILGKKIIFRSEFLRNCVLPDIILKPALKFLIIRKLILYSSSLRHAWSYILVAPQNPQVQALKALLDQHLDPDEDLEPFGFTIIHKIVLGLSRIDLSSQLELSTADIDTGCSLGKTPLIWAIQTGNEAVVRKLLEFQARIDIRDKKGYNSFHYAVSYAGCEMLKSLISAAHSQERTRFQINTQIPRNSAHSYSVIKNSVAALLDTATANGHTPLIRCCGEGFYELAKILIANGASVNNDRTTLKFRQIPLLWPVQSNYPAIITLLLDAGAHTDMKDEEGMTILHIAGVFGDIDTLKLLRDIKLCCLDTSERDIHGRTPLEEFDRLEFNAPEDPETRQRCREAFLELLESVKPIGSDHVCTVRGPAAASTESAVTFEEGEIEPSQEGSDDETFYETRSTFGDGDCYLEDSSQNGPLDGSSGSR